MKYLKTFEKKVNDDKLRVKEFGYKVIKEEPIENLKNYKNHRRLKVFYHKGVECVNPECKRVGTKLVHGKDNGGGIHIDLVTDNNFPFTIDHIYPKSKGGTNKLVNLDPMCVQCNKEKGDDDYTGEIKKGMVYPNGYIKPYKRKNKTNKKVDKRNKIMVAQKDDNIRRHKGEPRVKTELNVDRDVKVGDIVYRDRKSRSPIFLGKIVDIRPNPYHPNKALAAQIEDRDSNSLYPLSKLFKLMD